MNSKKNIIILAALLSAFVCFAADKCVKGIYYDFDKKTQHATVTFRGSTYKDYPNEYNGNVTIPSTIIYNGIIYTVTAISESAFRDCDSLKTVVIPKSVTNIGMFAFKNTALEKDSTRWENGIMYIDQCVVDAKYDIVEGDVNLRADTRLIGDYAFAECEKLNSLTMSDNVQYIGRMAFALCINLEKIHISTKVKTIRELTFWACIKLKKIELPDNVEAIEDGVFGGCMLLDSIILSPKNRHYIVLDHVLFTRDFTTLVCYPAGLLRTTYEVPRGVRQIGAWAFEAASRLTYIQLPDGLKYIWQGAFSGCEALHHINIPQSVDLIDLEAFARCFALNKLYIPSRTKTTNSIAEPNTEILRVK